jgi:sulfoxide reductase catalytic subunit YedY
MVKRRQFLKFSIGGTLSLGFLLNPLVTFIKWAYAETKRIILPKETTRQELINKDPKNLDTRYLEITDLKDFETMGTTDHEVELDEWRLEISGLVKKELALTYDDLLAMPSIEKKVLLICPGFFAQHGLWKGVSMKYLLEQVDIEKDATRVIIAGSNSFSDKVERFPIKDLLSNKVFLAYEVNGKPLPKKHGFPLRVVAEDYFGDDWVKYVNKMKFGKS